MLPNAEHAVVETGKVPDYLLSDAHPVGRFKARVFFALGYTTEGRQVLQTDVLALAQTGEVRPGQAPRNAPQQPTPDQPERGALPQHATLPSTAESLASLAALLKTLAD